MAKAAFLFCTIALFMMSLSEARAQQRVELTKVGLSILPPSQWSDTTMWKLFFCGRMTNGATGQILVLLKKSSPAAAPIFSTSSTASGTWIKRPTGQFGRRRQ